MAESDNPFCSNCHLRTFPGWGAHTCPSPKPDLARIRHYAGDVLSNLHFYRIPAREQLSTLTEALGLLIGTLVEPTWVDDVRVEAVRRLYDLSNEASARVRKNMINENLVMEVNRPRMKAKKGKPHANQANSRRNRSRNR
jgi:hypothetical protein